MKKKHLSVVPDTTEEVIDPVDDNEAAITALLQIAQRAPLGGDDQWRTEEMYVLFATALTIEESTSLSLNQIEAALDIPGLADAALDWEAESA